MCIGNTSVVLISIMVVAIITNHAHMRVCATCAISMGFSTHTNITIIVGVIIHNDTTCIVILTIASMVIVNITITLTTNINTIITIHFTITTTITSKLTIAIIVYIAITN